MSNRVCAFAVLYMALKPCELLVRGHFALHESAGYGYYFDHIQMNTSRKFTATFDHRFDQFLRVGNFPQWSGH